MFLWTLVLNSSFLHRSVKLDCKAIYIHKICICNVFCHFTRQCITTQFKTSQNIWENFFSFTDQSHLFNSRQIDWHRLRWFFLSYHISEKNDSRKVEVLRIFGSWDQEIDPLFANHEPLIPALHGVPDWWQTENFYVLTLMLGMNQLLNLCRKKKQQGNCNFT